MPTVPATFSLSSLKSKPQKPVLQRKLTVHSSPKAKAKKSLFIFFSINFREKVCRVKMQESAVVMQHGGALARPRNLRFHENTDFFSYSRKCWGGSFLYFEEYLLQFLIQEIKQAKEEGKKSREAAREKYGAGLKSAFQV